MSDFADFSDIEMINGAKAIARALNISPKQLRNTRHRGGLTFIWKEPGLGLVTSVGAIRAYQKARSQGNDPPPVPLDKAG